MERVHEILSQGGVNGARILLGFEHGFINPDELFPAPRVFAEAVVGDAVKPRGELRFATEAADVFVRFKEGLLGQVIGERHVGACKVPEQTTYRRLMPPHELRERMLIVMEEDSGDEVCIRQ